MHLVIFRNLHDVKTPFNCLRLLNGVFTLFKLFQMIKNQIKHTLLLVFSNNEQKIKIVVDKGDEGCYHIGCRDNEKRDTENVPVSPCVDESI